MYPLPCARLQRKIMFVHMPKCVIWTVIAIGILKEITMGF